MKKVALTLLVSCAVAISVNATWYDKLNPVPFVEGACNLVFDCADTGYDFTCKQFTENAWRTAFIAGAIAFLYKERKPIMRGANNILQYTGLKKKTK